MLDFVIFAVTFVVVLIIAVVYLYPGSSKTTTIPGIDPSDPKDGNLADIRHAGSLHQFLVDLHCEYGKIVSFWMGQQLVVSVASPEIFKQQANVFDRPGDLFQLYETLVGPDSVFFMNGAVGRKKRSIYDKCFVPDMVNKCCDSYRKCGEELMEKLSSLPSEEHVALKQYMNALSIKMLSQTLCGSFFSDPRKVVELHKKFDLCWTELESQGNGDLPDESRQKMFKQSKEEIINILKKAISHRKNSPGNDGEKLLIDFVLDSGTSEPQMLADLLTFLMVGFPSTSSWLTWSLYFLATHQPIQERLCREMKEASGGRPPTPQIIASNLFLRQVLDETLRCAVLVPWTARVQDFDVELGGHKVPSKTPVVQALGVVLQDEQLWPLPNNFDPSRFEENLKDDRLEHAFVPFGFSGKRKCPAQDFAYLPVATVLAILLPKFKVTMAEGQVVTPAHGLITMPKDEIWVMLEKRK